MLKCFPSLLPPVLNPPGEKGVSSFCCKCENMLREHLWVEAAALSTLPPPSLTFQSCRHIQPVPGLEKA